MTVARISHRRPQEQCKNDTPQDRLERHQQRRAANIIDKRHDLLKELVHIHDRFTNRSPRCHPFARTSQMPPDIGICQRKHGKQCGKRPHRQSNRFCRPNQAHHFNVFKRESNRAVKTRLPSEHKWSSSKKSSLAKSWKPS